MANQLQAPRGTLDVLPDKVYQWQYVESAMRDTAAAFGFREIRFPTFEYTELFSRGVGETTDVVQKEMYTFEDRGGRSVTLRPEGTASTVRLVLQNGLHNEPLPLKLFYLISCFRGEKPQAGRYREFHQFGAEVFGSADPAADAEVISLAKSLFDTLGIDRLRLEINSIGCPECRKNYHKALREYFEQHADGLCETCRGRLERNPMRILDCKSAECKKIAEDAPKVLDYICDDCRTHFDQVKARLSSCQINFTVNPSIVRGLDYYTRTVFEFIDDNDGLTVCGGGRYDGLVEQLGGPRLPALGFGLGLERLLMVMESRGCSFDKKEGQRVYLAPMGMNASQKAAELVRLLREEGFTAEYDLMGRSVKAQMKFADKRGFDYTAVIGDNELSESKAMLRNMKTGAVGEIPLDSGIVSAFYRITQKDALEGLCDSVRDS
ncbi:MAG TPA: histidine--tRNA ligase [Clostridia bacterium]|nr:histidine--tRNA ligase [Clostridia bacterium]